MIKLVNVSKKYESGVMALSDANIHIQKGEFVFVVGASGAGKSTFMKLLLKEEEPSDGEIYIAGQDITHLHRRKIPLLRRRMGVVFQDFRLLPNKTVYENVAFSMEILEAPRREIRRQVPVMLSMVGLSNRANMYPHQLSGGEQQRVSIARAMINNPHSHRRRAHRKPGPGHLLGDHEAPQADQYPGHHGADGDPPQGDRRCDAETGHRPGARTRRPG